MGNASERFEEDRWLPATIRLYYDLKVPGVTPAPLLIVLHGYGANKRQMMREARQMAPEGFAIASMQGFHQHIREPKEPGGPLRFGFGWLTNFKSEESVEVHHRTLLSLIRSLVHEGVADPARVFLLGFSQSCALNYRFAFTQPDCLRGVIGICGGAPGDWETSEVYQPTTASVLHIAGTRDEFYPPTRVAPYESQLRMRAEDVEFRSYDAAHEIVPEMRDDVQEWLTKRSLLTPDV
ncbi:MAG TPA: dienelactone hydrolase family protein [Pyrinomonadaceae bacterium]|nr:dienelactone hydrolase family protein [Pyrinomonadaceae bacterium]